MAVFCHVPQRDLLEEREGVALRYQTTAATYIRLRLRLVGLTEYFIPTKPIALALFCLLFIWFLSVCLLIFLVLLKVILRPVYSGHHTCLTRRSTAGSLLSRFFEIPLSWSIAGGVPEKPKNVASLLKMQTMDPSHRFDLGNFFFQIDSPNNKNRTSSWSNNSKGNWSRSSQSSIQNFQLCCSLVCEDQICV